MTDIVKNYIKCPVCGSDMRVTDDRKSIKCKGTRTHCFDIASSGYVNFSGSAGGDSKEAVKATSINISTSKTYDYQNNLYRKYVDNEKAEAEKKAEAERLAAEKKAAEQKAAAEAAAKRIAGAFGKGTQTGSKGTGTAGTGIQGSPTGNSAEGQSSGVGGYGSWDLNGRSLGSGGLPRPIYNVQEEGRVVVTITVNPAGQVIHTSINKRTNTANAALRKAAEDAARKATFNAVGGVNNQTGTITYYFKLK